MRTQKEKQQTASKLLLYPGEASLIYCELPTGRRQIFQTTHGVLRIGNIHLVTMNVLKSDIEHG